MTRPDGGGQAFVWPATAQAMNMDPGGQLLHLLSSLGMGPDALDSVARPGGAKLQRFDVIHVVRPRVDMPVMHLVRGDVLLPVHSITGHTLDDIAQRLTGALSGRILPEKMTFRGTYHPSERTFDPELADKRSAALACYALTLQAGYRLEVSKVDPQAKRLALSVAAIVNHMVGDGDGRGLSPGAGALALLSMVNAPAGGVDKQVRDRLAHSLMSLADGHGGFHWGDKKDEALPSATQALVTAALAQWYARTRDKAAGQLVDASLDGVWQRMRKQVNVSALPWLMLAQNKAMPALNADGLVKDKKAAASRAAGLGRLVSALVNKQIQTVPALGPADVVGGFQLAPLPEGAPPAPTWHSAEVLTLISEALRNGEVSRGHDELGWMLSAGLGARFIGQLMIDEPSCYYIQDKQAAMGSVRASLWDNRLPVSASAMSLLGVTQLQQTLSATAGASAGD